LDQRGIRSTHYVPGESWFGDECARCLFRGWRYHRTPTIGRCTSFFRAAKSFYSRRHFRLNDRPIRQKNDEVHLMNGPRRRLDLQWCAARIQP
jgi:hypothetical protein